MRIRDLLAIPHLRLRLLWGEEHLDRTIAGAQVTDLPDPGRYVGEGELVLTGLMWLQQPADCDRFADVLAAAGVAALGAGDARLGHIPEPLVEACRARGLPLIEVPVEVSFGAIVDEVNRRIAGARAGELSSALGRHRRIVAAVAEGVGLEELFALTASELGVTGGVISAAGTPIAGFPGLPPGERAALAARLAAEYLAAPRLPHVVRIGAEPGTRRGAGQDARTGAQADAASGTGTVARRAGSGTGAGARTDAGAGTEAGPQTDTGTDIGAVARTGAGAGVGAGTRTETGAGTEVGPLTGAGTGVAAYAGTYTLFSVDRSHRAAGWVLACAGEPGADVGLELAACVALERNRQEEGRRVERRLAAQLIALAGAARPEPAELAARLRTCGIETDDPYAAVAAAVRRPGATRGPDPAGLGGQVLEELLDRRVVAVAGADAAVAIVPLAAEGLPGTAEELAERLRAGVAALAPALAGASAAVGVSAAARGPSAVRGAVEEAGHARRMAESRGGGVVTSDEIYTHDLLLATMPDDVRRSFAARLLDPLFDYDRRYRSELVRTLATFLECTGSWHACADRLHIHVNTVRYRIRRVEELTGRDLSSMADRVDLFLALRAK